MRRYQLVLQFRDASAAEFDQLMALETTLVERLPASSEVDGHDWGIGEFNIFIRTDEPEESFACAEVIRLKSPIVQKPIAAFRLVSGETYEVLWPPDYQNFSIR